MVVMQVGGWCGKWLLYHWGNKSGNPPIVHVGTLVLGPLLHSEPWRANGMDTKATDAQATSWYTFSYKDIDMSTLQR